MDPTQPLLPLDDIPRAAATTRTPRRPPASVRAADPPPAPTPAVADTRAAGELPLLLTVRDVEAELQLGRTRAYELIRSGELPVVRLGGVVRVPRDALERWIESRISPPEPGPK